MWGNLGYGGLELQCKEVDNTRPWWEVRRSVDVEKLAERSATKMAAKLTPEVNTALDMSFGSTPAGSLSTGTTTGTLRVGSRAITPNSRRSSAVHMSSAANGKPTLSQRVYQQIVCSTAVQSALAEQYNRQDTSLATGTHPLDATHNSAEGGTIRYLNQHAHTSTMSPNDYKALRCDISVGETPSSASGRHARPKTAGLSPSLASSIQTVPRQVGPTGAGPGGRKLLTIDTASSFSLSAQQAPSSSVTAHSPNPNMPSTASTATLATLIDKHEVEPGLPTHAEIEKAFGHLMDNPHVWLSAGGGGDHATSGRSPSGHRGSPHASSGGFQRKGTRALSMSLSQSLNKSPSRWRSRARGSSMARIRAIPGLSEKVREGSVRSGRSSTTPSPATAVNEGGHTMLQVLSQSVLNTTSPLTSEDNSPNEDENGGADDDDDMGDDEMERQAVNIPSMKEVGPTVAVVEAYFRKRIQDSGASARCPIVSEELFQLATHLVRDIRRQRVALGKGRLEKLRKKLEALKDFRKSDAKDLETQIDDFEFYCEQLLIDFSRDPEEKGTAAEQLTQLYKLKEEMHKEHLEDVVAFEKRIEQVEERVQMDTRRLVDHNKRVDAPVRRVTASTIAGDPSLLEVATATSTQQRHATRARISRHVKAIHSAKVISDKLVKLSATTSISAKGDETSALELAAFPPVLGHITFAESEIQHHTKKQEEFAELQRKKTVTWGMSAEDFLAVEGDVGVLKSDYSHVVENGPVPFGKFKQLYIQLWSTIS